MNSENTMMGLPAGYPSKSQVDKIEKKNKEIRKKSDTDSEYVYNIVDEITDDVNNFIDEYFGLPLNEALLLEGGAAGHLAHPFEDGDLTFNDMKEMIKRGLVGGLDKEAPVTEKLDGQNIAFSFKDGKIIFGRNKGHVRDGGKNALDVKGITQQFAGRGGIEKAFVGAAEDLQVQFQN
jgi:hypothetical protein